MIIIRHHCHLTAPEKVDTVGAVVRSPNVRAPFVLPNAPKRAIARQMLKGQSR